MKTAADTGGGIINEGRARGRERDVGDREGGKREERVKRCRGVEREGGGDEDRAGCTYAARFMHRTGS